jgi:hypothetical protein
MSESVTATTPSSLEFTGERMVPEGAPPKIFWEHVYRYRFACTFVKGKHILDVACGEGYGAAAMRRAGARRVVGVDISQEVCEHARRKYAIDARQGDANHLPIANDEFQVVVSFETIEHVAKPADFVAECARALTPDGLLILSTPNRALSRDAGCVNPFHCSEMDRSELLDILSAHFDSIRLLTQCVRRAPWWRLRSFAIPGACWQKVRGSTRLRRAILPPWLTDGSATGTPYRADIVGTILSRDGILTKLLNPFAIRPALDSSQEVAEFYVAVCRNPR